MVCGPFNIGPKKAVAPFFEQRRRGISLRVGTRGSDLKSGWIARASWNDPCILLRLTFVTIVFDWSKQNWQRLQEYFWWILNSNRLIDTFLESLFRILVKKIKNVLLKENQVFHFNLLSASSVSLAFRKSTKRLQTDVRRVSLFCENRRTRTISTEHIVQQSRLGYLLQLMQGF